MKIDKNLIAKVPNKYNIHPKDIRKFKVLDWDRLKKYTWFNQAMKDTGEWYCHLEGSNGGGFYDDEDEFWIGFNKTNGKVNYHFSASEGMCRYNFTSFYSSRSIDNIWDLNVQMNALKYINMLLDKKIIALGE